MASKKTSKPDSSKTKPAPQPQPSRLQNLAANPATFDDTIEDEQLVDHSGLFRVTNALQQAQIGHDEEPTRRFPGPRERTGNTHQPQTVAVADESFDEAVTDHVIRDEAARAEKAARLATLAERARQPRKPR